MKKILYVHHAGNFGGAPKSLSYILSGLDRNIYLPTILNISDGPINEYFKKNLNCDIIVDTSIRPFHGSNVVENSLKLTIRNYLFLIPSVIKAFGHLRKINPTIIHLNSTCLFVFAIAAKLLKIKVICHIREPVRVGVLGYPLRLFNKMFVDHFIGISNYDLRSLGPICSTPSEVIYNFVDRFEKKNENIDEETNHLRNYFGIKKDDVVFLYLARFAESNGWKVLIDYSKELLRSNYNVHVILVGGSQTILNFSEKIHLVEFCTSPETYFKLADVFVCPFTLPHFARGIIEASAFSLPVLGNNVGGVDELILHGETGYLYNSKREFLNYSTSLIQNKLLRINLGENAYKFAKEKFDIKINLERTYDIYEKVMED